MTTKDLLDEYADNMEYVMCEDVDTTGSYCKDCTRLEKRNEWIIKELEASIRKELLMSEGSEGWKDDIRKEVIKELSVGSITDADKEAKIHAKGADMFMQGFLYARNNLQDCKNKIIKE